MEACFSMEEASFVSGCLILMRCPRNAIRPVDLGSQEKLWAMSVRFSPCNATAVCHPIFVLGTNLIVKSKGIMKM
jgi:hypothetical protein